ncbi:MAG: O-antigen ligase family protein [Xanthobacteraceae bacterium]
MIQSPEADAYFTAGATGSRAGPLTVKLLHGSLFLTVLVSPLVFVEPSPYEAAAALLALACIIAGVRFDRKILPLALLLLVFNAGGALTLLPIMGNETALTYAAISFYLAVTAFVYACLFAEDSLRRLNIMRRAYLIAAALACLIGIAGYFGFWPDAELYGRARATFKDPNVFGPFLVLPLLFVMQSLFFRGLRLRDLVLFGLFTFGLLLSFSRGAWAHFLLSAAVLVVLTFLTAPDLRTRARLILLSVMSIIALTGLVTVALSFNTVGELFRERAKLTQSYDVGSGGRFGLQEKAVGAMLENPGGMGPHEFERVYGGQQHNVYLQAFLVYGWAGGFAYILLIILTLAVGFRLAFVVTPWQPYLIAALATFFGEVVEGFVIDTDHWRHFYLLLGIIWGLAAATINAASDRRQRTG